MVENFLDHAAMLAIYNRNPVAILHRAQDHILRQNWLTDDTSLRDFSDAYKLLEKHLQENFYICLK